MKQLLIAKSNTALNKTANGTLSNANSLKDLVTGSLCFFTPDDNVILSSAPTKNFAIAIGRPASSGDLASGNQQNTFVIPEVDVNTLSVVKTLPQAGNTYSALVALSTPAVPSYSTDGDNYMGIINNYSIRLFKKGVVPHERNKWEITVPIKYNSTITTATALANAFKKKIEDDDLNMLNLSATVVSSSSSNASTLPSTPSDNDVIKYTGSNTTSSYTDSGNLVANNYYIYNAYTALWHDLGATLPGSFLKIATGNKDYTDWEVAGVDKLLNADIQQRPSKKPVGDANYIKNLCMQCAGDKGYFYTHSEARDFIPGYNVDINSIEDLTPNTSGSNGISTSGYVIYTLRFQVGRNSAKTRDEKVWQLVHIAIPLDNNATTIGYIDDIIPSGVMVLNRVPSDAHIEDLAEDVADARITARVISTARDQ